MTRVLVIDDHPIVLQGVQQLMEDAGVEQIIQAQSLADGFRLYRTQKPDVIVVDLAMRTGALGGLSFIRRLRLHDQRTPILVFTMHSDPVIVSRALEVGATGYVLKDTSSDEVLKAFQKVRQNRPYLSHDLASEVVRAGVGDRLLGGGTEHRQDEQLAVRSRLGKSAGFDPGSLAG